MVRKAASVAKRITKRPGVIGGDACIQNTRIPVWLLVDYRRLGASDKVLLDNYPTLIQEDLDAAWQYYEKHKNEIDEAIRQQNEA